MGSEKFGNSAKSGYNKGTIRRDIWYLVVSKDVRRHRLISISYVSRGRCHGRGREFDSRRPRHIFKHLQQTQKIIWVRSGPISVPSTPSAAHSLALSNTNYWTSVDLLADSKPPGNRIYQFSLRQAFALRRCLKILVRHMEIAVTQVVADRTCTRLWQR
jgi:hypothetical protein